MLVEPNPPKMPLHPPPCSSSPVGTLEIVEMEMEVEEDEEVGEDKVVEEKEEMDILMITILNPTEGVRVMDTLTPMAMNKAIMEMVEEEQEEVEVGVIIHGITMTQMDTRVLMGMLRTGTLGATGRDHSSSMSSNPEVHILIFW